VPIVGKLDPEKNEKYIAYEKPAQRALYANYVKLIEIYMNILI